MHSPRVTKSLISLILSITATCGYLPGAGAASADGPGKVELPLSLIEKIGPNGWGKGKDSLRIFRGRGSDFRWELVSNSEQRARFFIKYKTVQELNQDYQVSVGDQVFFSHLPVTGAENEAVIELAAFELPAGLPTILSLTPPAGTQFPEPVIVSKLWIEVEGTEAVTVRKPSAPAARPSSLPGFGRKLSDLHPSLNSADLRDEKLTLRVSGLSAHPAKGVYIATWDGEIFHLDDSTPTAKYTKVADSLREPMGLCFVGDRLFCTEKSQISELVDEDRDGFYEAHREVSSGWPGTRDNHEYTFGLVHRDGCLYFAISVAMGTRPKTNQQAPLRGSLLEANIETGEWRVMAGGLRTPDGVGITGSGDILITDNQGEWLPANKLIVVQEDAFYGFRSTKPWHPLDKMREDPAAVYLPQGEIAASPSQPIELPDSWGPYSGHIIFGDVTDGGLQRVVLGGRSDAGRCVPLFTGLKAQVSEAGPRAGWRALCRGDCQRF